MELRVKIKSAGEPHPDIHELFCHYNSLYFDDALSACIVYWSNYRTARSVGMCCYLEGVGCEIRLSEPLSEFRSTADLKNTLLHEMIHAFLYVTSNKRDRSYHGPSFSVIMDVINSSAKTDPQIRTVQKCTSCGDMIQGSTNREPSANDCIENMAHDNSCGNSLCHWHRHKMVCSGTYTETTSKPEYKDKIRVLKDAQVNESEKSKGSSRTTRQTKRRSQNVEHMIDLSSAEKPNIDDGVRRSSGIKSPCNTNRFQRNAT